MASLFHQLLDEAFSELTRRYPDYVSRFGFAFPPSDMLSVLRKRQPLLEPYSDGQLRDAGEEASRYLAGRGARCAPSEDMNDPLSLLMFDSIMDAFAAQEGLLRLSPGPRADRPISDTLAGGYDERSTRSGRRYFVRRGGTRPLVIVTALGIPIGVWSRLLGDQQHDFTIVVTETRCCGLLSGGMASDADLVRHSTDLAEVLEDEGLDEVDVLAWCNGGRIAIDLAARNPGRIRSLVLLSTTLRGAKDITAPPSAFEEKLQYLFSAILQQNALAKMMAKVLPNLVKQPNWDELAQDPRARAAALLRLPALEHAAVALIPMGTAEFFLNYARRTAADEAYPIEEALAALARASLPILLITGDHDDIVSNDAILETLKRSSAAFTHAGIAGAGHYSHDLQYPYFKWMLGAFLAEGAVPVAAARVRVEKL